MPASEIMAKFRAGTLHSGKGGPVVKSKKQATAIQLSYARSEGHNIPMADHLNKMKKKGILKKGKPKYHASLTDD